MVEKSKAILLGRFQRLAKKKAAIFNPMLRCFAQSGTSTLFRCSSRYPGNQGQWIDQHTGHVLSNGKEQPMLAHNGEQKTVRAAAIRKGVGNTGFV